MKEVCKEEVRDNSQIEDTNEMPDRLIFAHAPVGYPSTPVPGIVLRDAHPSASGLSTEATIYKSDGVSIA